MTRRLAPLALLFALVALPACDSSAEFVIGGTYAGQTNFQTGLEAEGTFVIPETVSGGTFTFTGVVDQEGFEPLNSSGTGTYDHPTVTLTADGDTITGTASADGSTLTFDGGSDEPPIVLRRQ